MTDGGRVYRGVVAHKRLRPKTHALSYDVFSLLLDVDRIDEVASRLRLFSRNRPNVIAFYDRDHGAGEDRPIAEHARHLLADAGIATQGGRIRLLAYPRVFGYVFNPISVYYAYDATDRLVALIYEVNNTFGQRTSYVVAAGPPESGIFHHATPKKMFVSPFADGSGEYAFRVRDPGEELLLAVMLRDREGPLIKTYFKAKSSPLTDGVLAGLLLRIPLMTVKVIAAIHWEALKLWLKGVPLAGRHVSPAFSVSNGQSGGRR